MFKSCEYKTRSDRAFSHIDKPRDRVQELRLADSTRDQDPKGHDANLREVADHVRLTTFEEWVRKRYQGVKGDTNPNGVTLWGLIMGW
jgi:hypothetical protein